MPEKEFVCIVCPNSCKLTVTENESGLTVTGAGCKRGIEHGESEYVNPKRMLTTTVAIHGGIHPRLSVVSSEEIPRSKMPECLELLYELLAMAPVKAGDIIVKNICQTGVDIVAARSMSKSRK